MKNKMKSLIKRNWSGFVSSELILVMPLLLLVLVMAYQILTNSVI